MCSGFSHPVLILYGDLKRYLKIWKWFGGVCLVYDREDLKCSFPAFAWEHCLVCFVFTEAMCPSLSPGIASACFLLCNTLVVLHAQVLYKEGVSPGTAIGKTPEMMRVKTTQDHISSVKTNQYFLASFVNLQCLLSCTENLCHCKRLMFCNWWLCTTITTSYVPVVNHLELSAIYSEAEIRSGKRGLWCSRMY